MNTEKRHRVSPAIRRRARELRLALTPPERTLWSRLRNRQLEGIKFRRQSPVGRYIVDFYCAEYGLVVELDGSTHDGRHCQDHERTLWLAGQGIRVVRFTNDQVTENLNREFE